MEQLITSPTDIGYIHAQSLGEPCQTDLLARGGVPVCDELAERLIDLAFDRDHTKLLPKPSNHQEVSLAVAARRSEFNLSLKEAIHEFSV